MNAKRQDLVPAHLNVLMYGDIGGSGGYIRYCRGLLASRGIPPDITIHFVCTPRLWRELQPVDPEVKGIMHPWPASRSMVQRYAWHLLLYPRLIRQIKPDVEFYPSGQLRVYLRRATTVATCHNLLLFDQVELDRFQDAGDRRYFQSYRARQANSFQRADGVIFLSQHSRQVVRNDLPGVKRDAVISHGLDPVFRLASARSYEFGQTINLLYVSTIHFYKHHDQVVRAVDVVRRLTGLDVRLRLVGAAATAQQYLLEVIREAGAEEFVQLAGAVDTARLVDEYRNADLFIFASSSETFGITLVEAMGARLPIACSDRTGLPDILQDAGLYFDPENYESIARTLLQLVQSEGLRQELGERAYHYSQNYSWQRCAHETFQFIRRVYDQATA